MTTLGTANATETVCMPKLDTLIWSTAMIQAEPDPRNTSAAWPDLPISAMECVLFYCVTEYETIVSNGAPRVVKREVPDATRVAGS